MWLTPSGDVSPSPPANAHTLAGLDARPPSTLVQDGTGVQPLFVSTALVGGAGVASAVPQASSLAPPPIAAGKSHPPYHLPHLAPAADPKAPAAAPLLSNPGVANLAPATPPPPPPIQPAAAARPASGSAGRGDNCCNCGQRGHLASACPTRTTTDKNKQAAGTKPAVRVAWSTCENCQSQVKTEREINLCDKKIKDQAGKEIPDSCCGGRFFNPLTGCYTDANLANPQRGGRLAPEPCLVAARSTE